MTCKRLELGRKHEHAILPPEVQRLLTESIPRQVERPLLPVPQCEREHPCRIPQRRRQSEMLDRRQERLRIGRALPGGHRTGSSIHPVSQLLMIVYLPVERNDVAARTGAHRLVPGGRQIDHRQTPMSQRDAGGSVEPYVRVVRSAMRQRVPPSSTQPAFPALPESRRAERTLLRRTCPQYATGRAAQSQSRPPAASTSRRAGR